MTSEEIDKIKKNCWNRAVYAYGTAWLFEKRANKLRRNLKLTQLLAIAVPVSVGNIAMSFSAFPDLLQNAIIFAGALSFIQIILAVVSLIYHWEENYLENLKALEINTNLRMQWEELAKDQLEDLKERYEKLKKLDQQQEVIDMKRGITENDKRMMMRASLYNYNRACAKCGKTPEGMKPSNCEVCGSF